MLRHPGAAGREHLSNRRRTRAGPALPAVVVLLGEPRADEADEGVAVREDHDHVGASADLPVQALALIVLPIGRQTSLGRR